MKTLFNPIAKMLLGIALIVPSNGHDLVANDHLTIGLVAIALLVWAIFDIAIDADRDLKDEATNAIGAIIYEGPARNDYRSTDFARAKAVLRETDNEAPLAC